MTRTKMVECEPCGGTGLAPYSRGIRCGTCHGAGEVEVLDDEPAPAELEADKEINAS